MCRNIFRLTSKFRPNSLKHFFYLSEKNKKEIREIYDNKQTEEKEARNINKCCDYAIDACSNVNHMSCSIRATTRSHGKEQSCQ